MNETDAEGGRNCPECWLPVQRGRDGTWRHKTPLDAVMCALTGGGGMLAPLLLSDNKED